VLAIGKITNGATRMLETPTTASQIISSIECPGISGCCCLIGICVIKTRDVQKLNIEHHRAGRRDTRSPCGRGKALRERQVSRYVESADASTPHALQAFVQTRNDSPCPHPAGKAQLYSKCKL
jgi:hypothetical protein